VPGRGKGPLARPPSPHRPIEREKGKAQEKKKKEEGEKGSNVHNTPTLLNLAHKGKEKGKERKGADTYSLR